MPHGQQLILIKANKSRPDGHWSDDVYDVRDADRKVISRIFLATMVPEGQPWFWTITARLPQWPHDRGYAATREEAMVAFKRAWDT
jgi:hypothetical protein